MREKPTVILAGKDAARLDQLKGMMGEDFQILFDLDNFLKVFQASKVEAPDFVVLDVEDHDAEAISSGERIENQLPNTSVILLTNQEDPDLILSAMRVGLRRIFIYPGEETEILAALGEERKQERVAEGSNMYTFFSSKGGGGSTILAVNYADALRRLSGKKVCIVDLAMQMGEVNYLLDLDPKYTIEDLVASHHRLDESLLYDSLVRHKSGLYVLAQPRNLEEAETMDAGEVASVLRYLSTILDYVVVDTGHDVDKLTYAAMNLSESVYMVINQLMPDIRKTKKTIDLLEKLNFDMDKISLVINRFFDNHPDLGLEDVQRLLSRRVDHTVANDWMSVSDSINQGILLSQGRRKSQVREDLERIAEQKVDTVVPVEKKGFLSSMLGKKDGLSGNGINAA